MYELIKLAENSYYIESPAKIGVVTVGNGDAVIIDSGSDKDAGKKVKRILEANGWLLKSIFCTHSHADHIGGNKYLQAQYGCKIYAPGIERDFTAHPILEPSLLYGANPPKSLKHKFLMAEASEVLPLTPEVLPSGMEIIPLSGHSFDMVGFKTADGICYIADCLSSAETLDKYKVGYIYDIGKYLETLEKVKSLDAKCFVPSHAAVCEDIRPLCDLNESCVKEIAEAVTELCAEGDCFESLLEKLFEKYSLRMTIEQHALVGSTLRSYLTYLSDLGKIHLEISGSRLIWKKNTGDDLN